MLPFKFVIENMTQITKGETVLPPIKRIYQVLEVDLNVFIVIYNK